MPFSFSKWLRSLGKSAKTSTKKSRDHVLKEAWAFIKSVKSPRLRSYLSASLKYMIDDTDTLDPPHKPKGVNVSDAVNRLVLYLIGRDK